MSEEAYEIPVTTLFTIAQPNAALDHVQELAAVEVRGVEGPNVSKAIQALKHIGRKDVSDAVAKMWDFDALKVMAQAWSRSQKIRKAIAESVAAPTKPKTAPLSEHVIESRHRPRLVLTIGGADWCQIEFGIVLSLTIESAELTLLAGKLTHVRLGPATGKVKMECKGVEIKEFHHEFKLVPEYPLKNPMDLTGWAAAAAKEHG
jgi:hypothetical protein